VGQKLIPESSITSNSKIEQYKAEIARLESALAVEKEQLDSFPLRIYDDFTCPNCRGSKVQAPPFMGESEGPVACEFCRGEGTTNFAMILDGFVSPRELSTVALAAAGEAERLLRLTCEHVCGTPVAEQSNQLADISLAIETALAAAVAARDTVNSAWSRCGWTMCHICDDCGTSWGTASSKHYGRLPSGQPTEDEKCPRCSLAAAVAERERLNSEVQAGKAMRFSGLFDECHALHLEIEAMKAPPAVGPEIELPDAEGWWWEWNPGVAKWVPRSVSIRAGVVTKWGQTTNVKCKPGRWVRANPPSMEEMSDGK
jgi:hypothetical protein